MSFYRANFYGRVYEAGGTDDLFYDNSGGLSEFVGAGRGGDVDDLAGAAFELVEFQGAIIHRAGKAKAIVDEVLLAAAVAVPHAVELRDGDVGLVDEEEEVAGKVVQQCGWRFAGKAAGEVARVVLDTVAIADGFDHFEIEAGALVDALGFDEAALGFEFFLPPFHLGKDGIRGGLLAFGLDDVVGLWVDGKAGVLLLDRAEEWIDLREGVDLVAKELDPVGHLIIGGVDLDDVAAHTEGSTAKIDVVAIVEDLDEAAGDVFAFELLALFEEQEHAVISFGRPQAVDAADRADDDGVAPFKEAACCGEAKLVQFLVDGGFFFDEEVAGWNVGLGLVVVVVGHEVLDGVVREECLEFVIKLRGEGLVVCKNERGAVQLFDDLCHGEGLAGAGDSEQHLVLFARGDAGYEFADGAWLVSLGLVGGCELKVHPYRIKQGGACTVQLVERRRNEENDGGALVDTAWRDGVEFERGAYEPYGYSADRPWAAAGGGVEGISEGEEICGGIYVADAAGAGDLQDRRIWRCGDGRRRAAGVELRDLRREDDEGDPGRAPGLVGLEGRDCGWRAGGACRRAGRCSDRSGVGGSGRT